jgi:LysR family glycine cleavage system transcriptional activator
MAGEKPYSTEKRSRLPPLNAVRAFEASARHLSFKKAAKELDVTPGAISQQIKRLENDLGVELFQRSQIALALTPAGNQYFPIIRDAFEHISEMTERLRGGHLRGDCLTVSSTPGFAQKWLAPRLGRFRQANPGIEVRITTSKELVDFKQDGVDVAIRHGLGQYSGLKSWHLLAEDMTPVCSPNLLKSGTHSLRNLQDLRRHTLLHDHNRRDWELWLKAAGAAGVDATRGPGFSDDAAMLEAAIEGQGVALGRSTLIARDLVAGRLVRPFGVRLPNQFAYYLVCPEARSSTRKITSFRDWLRTEVTTDSHSPEQRDAENDMAHFASITRP